MKRLAPETLDEMEERHFTEYEDVHNGSGRSEEFPSDLRKRHQREMQSLLKRSPAVPAGRLGR